jgi:hypothetical protein
MKKMNPPPWLSASHVPGFESLCERLRASGVELTELDAIVVARVAQAEASLERARAEAAQAPLIIGSPANGECVHPAQRLLQSAEANLRQWLKLLPKTSNGGHPVYAHTPHVVPSVADVASKAGPDVAGPDGHDGEPPERVLKLRAMLREFWAKQGAGVEAGGAVEAANVAE